MTLTKEFIDAVDNGKKTRVRIMLKDIMLVDPSLKKFNEMLAYAEKNLLDLYDEHNGEDLIYNSSMWDEDYMNQQMVLVVNNFSRERIELLKKIVEKLYSYKIYADLGSDNNTSSSGYKEKNSLTTVQVTGGVIAVAGAGALIGGIVSSSAAIAIMGGIAMTGGIAMVALGGNREE